MIHKVKIEKRFYDRLLTGRKSFEIRRNDRDYQVGDLLEFSVVDTHGVPETMRVRWHIDYLHHGYGMEEGFVALAVKPERP